MSPDFRTTKLRTSDFGLRTSDFGLRTSDFGLRTSDFGLRTSDFGPGITDKKKRSLWLRFFLYVSGGYLITFTPGNFVLSNVKVASVTDTFGVSVFTV